MCPEVIKAPTLSPFKGTKKRKMKFFEKKYTDRL